MRWSNLSILTVIGLLVLFAVAAQAGDAADVPAKAKALARQLDSVLDSCDSKRMLAESRSCCLRACARDAAHKAEFIRDNRNQLIRSMVSADVAPKDYRVKRFVNEAFNRYQAAK